MLAALLALLLPPLLPPSAPLVPSFLVSPLSLSSCLLPLASRSALGFGVPARGLGALSPPLPPPSPVLAAPPGVRPLDAFLGLVCLTRQVFSALQGRFPVRLYSQTQVIFVFISIPL